MTKRPTKRSAKRSAKQRQLRWPLIWKTALKRTAIVVGSTLAVAAVVAASLWIWAGGDKVTPDKISWGYTFSSGAARGLGLDPHAAYTAMLDGLHPQRLRLVAYWTDIEPADGRFDYSDLDFQISEAEKRGIPYVIVTGRKVPRWPECYTPDWAKRLPTDEQHSRILRQVQNTINRYDARPHLLRWQVENEPYLNFGDGCPGPDEQFLKAEVAAASQSTHRPIMLTDSGETKSWLGPSQFGDIFGTTLYRVVLNKKGSTFHHFLWPEYYTRHGNLIKKIHPNIKQLVVAELQAEPWTEKGLTNIDQAYIDLTLSHKQFTDNIEFTREVGFSEAYLWGAEWWYYRKLHGDDFYWNTARDVFAQSVK
jgi:hypothetical protein